MSKYFAVCKGNRMVQLLRIAPGGKLGADPQSWSDKVNWAQMSFLYVQARLPGKD